jgi:hypothetical protein
MISQSVSPSVLMSSSLRGSWPDFVIDHSRNLRFLSKWGGPSVTTGRVCHLSGSPSLRHKFTYLQHLFRQYARYVEHRQRLCQRRRRAADRAGSTSQRPGHLAGMERCDPTWIYACVPCEFWMLLVKMNVTRHNMHTLFSMTSLALWQTTELVYMRSWDQILVQSFLCFFQRHGVILYYTKNDYTEVCIFLKSIRTHHCYVPDCKRREYRSHLTNSFVRQVGITDCMKLKITILR